MNVPGLILKQVYISLTTQLELSNLKPQCGTKSTTEKWDPGFSPVCCSEQIYFLTLDESFKFPVSVSSNTICTLPPSRTLPKYFEKQIVQCKHQPFEFSYPVSSWRKATEWRDRTGSVHWYSAPSWESHFPLPSSGSGVQRISALSNSLLSKQLSVTELSSSSVSY